MKKFLITLSLALTLLAALPFASMAAPATSEAAEPGFFSLLYEAAGAHLAEILSALSAASAIAIAFCYNKWAFFAKCKKPIGEIVKYNSKSIRAF